MHICDTYIARLTCSFSIEVPSCVCGMTSYFLLKFRCFSRYELNRAILFVTLILVVTITHDMESSNMSNLHMEGKECYAISKNDVPHPTFYCGGIAINLHMSYFDGNTLCLVVLYKNTTARFPVRLFLAFLATNDICIGLLMALPSTIAAMYDDWVFGCTFCNITATMLPTSVTVRVLSLLLLNIDTYLVIKLPLKYHLFMTSTRAKIAVAVLWILSFLQIISYFPPLSSLSFKRIPVYGYVYLRCFKTYEAQRDYILLTTIAVFITLPFVVTVYVYVQLFLIARNQSMSKHYAHFITRQKSNKNAIRTFFIVTLAFGLSSMPLSVVAVLETVADVCVPYTIRSLSYLLVFFGLLST